MRPTRIQVHILKPLYPDQFINNDNKEDSSEENLAKRAQGMTAELENQIREKGKLFYG